MSKISTVVRYDGPALVEHSMDVADLAPALLGLSEIVKIANQKINGELSAIKVLVNVDIEQKCFQFIIEVNQTLMQHFDLLVSDNKVSSAKELAEWIGIIGGPSYGLFKSYKWVTNQGVTLNELDIRQDGSSVTLRNVKSNGSITINANVYNMINDTDILKNTKDVVRPLTKEGYDKLQFEQEDEIIDEISSEEGKRIYDISKDALELQLRVNKSISNASLKVKKPDLLGNSKWSFILDKAIDVKIEDGSWLEKFHKGEIPIPPGSYLDVVLRTEIELNDNNDPTGNVSYYVVEVKNVIPPAEQAQLFTFPTRNDEDS